MSDCSLLKKQPPCLCFFSCGKRQERIFRKSFGLFIYLFIWWSGNVPGWWVKSCENEQS